MWEKLSKFHNPLPRDVLATFVKRLNRLLENVVKTTGTNSRRPYDNVVYQRMRHILMGYRNLWRGNTGQKYEWGELAEDIATFSDIDFPRNSLENFVRGWYEEEKIKKSASENSEAGAIARVYKYSIPQDDRAEAIIRFLTDKSSKGWFCDREQLLALPKFQAPFFLQEQLNHPNSPKRYLLPEQLQGDYLSHYHGVETTENDKKQTHLNLHIAGVLGNGAVIVDLVKSGPYTHGDRTTAGEPIEDAHDLYFGWAVLSSEENLFVFTKHFRTNCNMFYLSLGIDNRIYAGDPPEVLVLFAHDFTEDSIPVTGEADERTLLATIEGQMLKKLVLLRRVRG